MPPGMRRADALADRPRLSWSEMRRERQPQSSACFALLLTHHGERARMMGGRGVPMPVGTVAGGAGCRAAWEGQAGQRGGWPA